MMLSHTLRQHALDCLALASSITPIYAIVEVWFLGMSVLVSAHARLITIALMLAGIGSVFARLRDMSLRLTGLSQSTSARLRVGHDLGFNIVVNAILAPAVYWISGATAAQMLAGTLVCIAVASVTGPLNGLMLDRFRAWAGLASTSRFAPSSPPAFASIAASVAVSVVLVSAAYGIARF